MDTITITVNKGQLERVQDLARGHGVAFDVVEFAPPAVPPAPPAPAAPVADAKPE